MSKLFKRGRFEVSIGRLISLSKSGEKRLSISGDELEELICVLQDADVFLVNKKLGWVKDESEKGRKRG